jgi:hypothetical protein
LLANDCPNVSDNPSHTRRASTCSTTGTWGENDITARAADTACGQSAGAGRQRCVSTNAAVSGSRRYRAAGSGSDIYRRACSANARGVR